MTLPTLPIPDIPTLVERLLDNADVFLSPAEYVELKTALQKVLLDDIEGPNTPYQLLVVPALEVLKSNAAESEHGSWSNVWFKKLLLSTRFPIANTIRVCTVVDVEGPREIKEGRVIRALAVWGTECVWGEREVGGLLAWQMKGYWATFREPESQAADIMRTVEGKPKHIVAWWKGQPWRVEVIGEDGKVLSEGAIQEQIEAIKKSETKEGFELAACAWRTDRPAWSLNRDALKGIPENGKSFETVYSSLFSVALEDYEAPAKLGDLLNDVRIGTKSPNRFPDQTLTAVIYADGATSFAFDHTPADCGPGMELSQAVVDFAKDKTVPVSASLPSSPTHLPFKGPEGISVNPEYTEPLPREVETFEIKFPSNLSKNMTAHRLVDPIINLGFQEALLHHTTLARIDPIFQPVWIRAFRGGRCDPFCPVTKESLAFLKLFFEGGKKDDEETYKKLSEHLVHRKKLIRERMDGKAVNYFQQGFLHPSFGFASGPSSIVPDEYIPYLKTIVNAFARIAGVASDNVNGDESSVQFTGFTTKYPEIKGGLSNIYLPDQMVVFYVWREDTAVVTLSATGRYKGEELQRVKKGYESAVKELVEMAERFVDWKEKTEKHEFGVVEAAR